MAAQDLRTSEWERSKIFNQDINLMKKLGLTKKKDALRFPSEESYPTPPMEYRVSFVDHLIRGLSAHIHDFLRGLLFVYGLQLHQLTPNSILHISIFITLCECFLGVHPNWALWKRIFCLRRNGSHNIAYNIGDSGTSKTVKSPIEETPLEEEEKAFNPYDDALISSGDEEEDPPVNAIALTSTSRTLVISETRPITEETSPPQQDIGHPTPVVSPRAPSPKRARIEMGKESSLLTGSSATPPMDDPLMKEFIRLGAQFIGYRDHADKLKEALSEANKRADDLSLKLEQSEKAREKAESDAAAVEGLRKRLHDAENALSENTTRQSAREENIIARLELKNRRFVRRMHQDFELETPEDVPS
ncbi:hypothetical protein QYE76_063682 [Lolium multiflorum]|uniref:Transposase (putative) gypsy type domain-containing protein n=1 Tax=Lolium multiflorum TaxID=4521 RepID=A0AAD8S5G0_LOLMU|nr:hypothetical protein QYE76_063682 [Lolium multiflorum]